MQLVVLQIALLMAVFSAAAFALFGYCEKLEIGAAFCAEVVAVMLTCAVVLDWFGFWGDLFPLWLLLVAVMLDFLLMAAAFGFSWKLLLKTLAANGIAAVLTIVMFFVWLVVVGLTSCACVDLF